MKTNQNAFWMADGHRQDLKQTAEFISDGGASLLMLVPGEGDRLESWNTLVVDPTDRDRRTNILEALRHAFNDNSNHPNWRLAVELVKDQRTGTTTAYVHCMVYGGFDVSADADGHNKVVQW